MFPFRSEAVHLSAPVDHEPSRALLHLHGTHSLICLFDPTIQLKHHSICLFNSTIQLKHNSICLFDSTVQLKHHSICVFNSTVQLEPHSNCLFNLTIRMKSSRRCLRGGIDARVVDSGRGTTRAEDAQGTPTQIQISPSILVYEDKKT